jgi:hypothetical protein
MTAIRRAEVRGVDTVERLEAYLPTDYTVESFTDGVAIIVGTDYAGWTLDDYVLPRLASGLMFGQEIK